VDDAAVVLFLAEAVAALVEVKPAGSGKRPDSLYV
jgi:hypothetical protein